MIKYIGSKRRLLPALRTVFGELEPVTALDLFTGTTRVAQALKEIGAHVTAVDTTRFAAVLAQCYVETDADTVDSRALDDALAHLRSLPGEPGYVTETFCTRSRFFQPANGERIDAVRQAIATDYAGSPLEPVLLTSLLEAADRVDSTTGVQMAYVKQWSARSYRPLELRRPMLVRGPGKALRADACEVVGSLGSFDVAYLDPPYNQHRYDSNYHVWETIVAWDAPAHYGVACKREELRATPASVFNSRLTIGDALARIVRDLDAGVIVLSYNDESWLSLDELVSMCAGRGATEVLRFPSARYVGARIGIHNPAGEKVGTVGRLRNVEYVILSGASELLARAMPAVEILRSA
ncbi:MAG: DNA adenine methylase [Acidimicrobiales bacterium]